MERGRTVNPLNHQVGSNPTTLTMNPLLHKVKHLRLTMLDYSQRKNNYKLTMLPESDRLKYREDFDFIDKLEKRLIETLEDGYGYDLNKDEMSKCNYLYKRYKAAPYRSAA